MKQHSGIFYQQMASIDEADIVLLGLPWDGTVSGRAGARFGPQAIRSATLGIEDYSPYQDRDIARLRLYDHGDMELPFGDTDACLGTIREEYSELMTPQKKCLALGGEHLVSLPLIEMMHERYGKDLFVIQFDAHTDLRADYLGVRYSHATVMTHVADKIGLESTAMIGIRSGTAREWNILRSHPYIFGGASDRGIDEFSRFVKEHLRNRKVYLTIDLDVFDPGIMCGTGTPEAGGISFREFIGIVKTLHETDVVGADIVELAPDYDHSGASSFLAGVVLREILLLMGGNR